jgi:rRNA small subunit pseudouridine methyltransferase Nep1
MFNRFTGLIEHLFLTGEAPPEKPLLRLESASLAGLIERIKPKKVITFSELGRRKLCRELFDGISREDEVCVVVGGFPHGEFLSNVVEVSNELVSIDPELLRAPTVTARAIYAYEETLGIQELRLRR